MVFHWTRLLWLHGFTGLEIMLAHCSRSAQGAGPFHYGQVSQRRVIIMRRVISMWGVPRPQDGQRGRSPGDASYQRSRL
jgi:hypothetical protein